MWQSFSSVSAISSNGSSRLVLKRSCEAMLCARHAEEHGAGLDEFLVVIAELHRLGRAAGRVVLRVEVQHDDLAAVGLRRELHSSCCKRLEFRNGFIDVQAS